MRKSAAARAAVEGAEVGRRELDKLQTKLDALHRDKRMHDELDRAFSDLRTDLNFALRPEVSELASGFLADLTDGRYGELELDDQYNIIVLEDGVPKPVISGGEEDLATSGAAPRDLADDRRTRGPGVLVCSSWTRSSGRWTSPAGTTSWSCCGAARPVRAGDPDLRTSIRYVKGLDRVITVRYDDDRGCSVVDQAGRGRPAGLRRTARPSRRTTRVDDRRRRSIVRCAASAHRVGQRWVDGGRAELEAIASGRRSVSGAT